MTINIEYETNIILDIDYKDIILSVVKKALELEDCPYEIELNIILSDNNGIWEINKTYRNMDKPTDVLSFPMIEYETPSDFSSLEDSSLEYFHPETGELLLGDIIVSVEKVMEQAKEYGHSLKRELAFLIAHSMMHLCGYDHINEEERLVMEEKQEEILKRLHIGRLE